MARFGLPFVRLPAQKLCSSHQSPLVPYPDRPAASGRLAAVDAALDLINALLQTILNNLDGLAGRLPRGGRTVLRARDGNLETLFGELRLRCEVVLKLAKRLVATGEFCRLLQPRLEDLALLLRHRLSALRGNRGALAEGIDVLPVTLNQLVDIDLRQAKVTAEFPQHVDVRSVFICHDILPSGSVALSRLMWSLLSRKQPSHP